MFNEPGWPPSKNALERRDGVHTEADASGKLFLRQMGGCAVVQQQGAEGSWFSRGHTALS